jgi:hypothetical protein
MDDIVRQAMAKWPDVPDCYGWLGLSARGQWYLRDAHAQRQGSFGSGQPGAKGTLLQHEKLIAFIQRNYADDGQGRWHFQNGPQRVYVELEITPWVWRVEPGFEIHSHTGLQTQCQRCLSDAQGRVYLQTPLGLGLVHTQDVGWVANALEAGVWTLEELGQQNLPATFGFVLSPALQDSCYKNNSNTGNKHAG